MTSPIRKKPQNIKELLRRDDRVPNGLTAQDVKDIVEGRRTLTETEARQVLEEEK